jgi:double-stranded uracil-DNA glycosylase
MRYDHPFDPIADEASAILILGSFPSIRSFEMAFYYAHPRNQFWPIMERLFETSLPDTDARTAFLHRRHIALWDVYGSLRREQGNSSDANLQDARPNDIPAFLSAHPTIRRVYCTGGKAYDALRRAFPDLDVAVVKLPSTSPAYAAMRFETKLEAYAQIREFV